RRVLLARIDAQSEKPYTRDFSFDPAQVMTNDRLHYVVAALTIVRAYITAGRPKVASGRTASFEHWDDLVRQPLCWLAGLVRQSGDPELPTLADPMEAAARAFEQDPETTKLAAMLEAWHEAFGGMQTTVASVIRRGDTDERLGTALEEIAGQAGKVNSRMLGRWIERMTGRIVGGRLFVRVGLRAGVLHWSVGKVGGASAQPQIVDAPFAAQNPPNGTKPTKPGQAGHEGADSQSQNVDAPFAGTNPPEPTKPTKNRGSVSSDASGVVGLVPFGGFSEDNSRAHVGQSGAHTNPAGDDVEFFE
nr:hypothetical protein [Acidovorax sp.]